MPLYRLPVVKQTKQITKNWTPHKEYLDTRSW